jgi:AAA domain/Nuclease-related domain
MTCKVVQTQPPNNAGERRMFAFLKYLPESYWLFSELKLNMAFNSQVDGLREKRPDFVVTGAEVGVVSVEVKEWNLDRYEYRWLNQYEVGRFDRRSGSQIGESVDNPGAQVAAYFHGLKNLIRERLPVFANELWVTSLLAFPTLTKHEFLNGVQNLDLLTNPQGKFYVDLDRMIFKDQLDHHADHPEKLLEQIVSRDDRFRPASGKAIYKVNETLVPSKFRVGGDAKLQEARQKLKTLSDQQAKWAFRLEAPENYLLDVAGSGKTNVLLSRAIHLVDQAVGKAPDILITTYSRHLEKSLERILRDKILSDDETQYTSIRVLAIPSLLERVVQRAYGDSAIRQFQDQSSNEESYVNLLLGEVKDVLNDDPARFQIFDYIFIDEIQDFSDAFLRVVKSFARSDRFFFVGDVGQKIYPRHHDLDRLGLTTRRTELEKSFRMYRTPRYIAELATRFILQDIGMQQEFRAHGYTQPFEYSNRLEHGAEFHRSDNPEQEAANQIRKLLETSYVGGEHQILVVASTNRLEACERFLQKEGIACQLGESRSGENVAVVDFSSAKGLEREVVVVLGIEDLYHHETKGALFDDVSEQIDQEALDRRKVYVTLTRPLERLIVYYTDPGHPYVKALCELNERIAEGRISHGQS